jgi:MFS family permease
MSTVGDFATATALPFAVLAHGGSPTDVALVAAAGTLPRALLVLVGGVIGDRYSRRTVMMVADFVRAGVQACMCAALVTTIAPLWSVIVLQILNGTASAVFAPASSGLLPEIVSGDDLLVANAAWGSSFAAAAIGGAAVGGVIASVWSPGWAIGVDSTTYVVSALSIRSIGRVGSARSDIGALRGLREATAALRTHRWLAIVLVQSIVFYTGVVGPYFVLGPVIFHRGGEGAGAWAPVLAGIAVGYLFGSFTATLWRPRRPFVVSAVIMYAYAVQIGLLAWRAPLLLVAALAVPAGFAVGFWTAIFTAEFQRRVPLPLQSRMMALVLLGSFAGQPIGGLIAGRLAERVTPTTILTCSAAICVISLTVVLAQNEIRSITGSGSPEYESLPANHVA